MTLYDAAMVCLVVGGMVWGTWRGITWQLAGMASLILGYAVARTASEDLAVHFPGDPLLARGLAMIVIYATVSGAIFFVAWTIRASLRKLRFEAYDRHLGMVLGGIEGLAVGIVATLFIVSLAPSSRSPIFESTTGRIVGVVMRGLGPVLPDEARTVLKPFWDEESSVVATDDEKSDRPTKTASDDLAKQIEQDLLHEVEANVGRRAVKRR